MDREGDIESAEAEWAAIVGPPRGHVVRSSVQRIANDIFVIKSYFKSRMMLNTLHVLFQARSNGWPFVCYSFNQAQSLAH